MPELDQLLDTLGTEVNAGTRAPGAPMAIKQANRRRAKIRAGVAGAAVALIATAGGLAGGPLTGTDEGHSPVGEPTRPTPPPPEPSSINSDQFGERLQAALAREPAWTIRSGDPIILHPCSGDWSRDAGGMNGGSIPVGARGNGPYVWHSQIFFPSAAQASDAVARLVDNLGSCAFPTWQTQAITQTGAVLASSAVGVAWIQVNGATVTTLQGSTHDGPPPANVQVEVAALLRPLIE